ncbi:DUF1134 domain-containing protein [Alteraurantiacibacter aquimixticola]|uniref:DUF1134 domain-containing protein n=1 Tax=Alteraurantiacibacter aquimixticola TaxID=2489173 RepID=A0A4T3F4L3_9SPHN|nr:DUF1134 domain-containing protein [Alteraurantiacibacter aquimixticola]TIX49643.1 DUF1134 domain-containing protein [Alteraurantiacibacter aquimixticola]
MPKSFADICRKGVVALAAAALAVTGAAGASAQQIETVDPDMAIDADLVQPSSRAGATADTPYQVDGPSARYTQQPTPTYPDASNELPPEVYPAPVSATTAAPQPVPATTQSETTYAKDDLIGAAEGLFGRGAEGLARLIEDILEEQGEPDAYIVGREGGGAFVFGVRYGSGTLYHRIEGNQPIYWTGPSIGFDAGANAGNTFVLVYNVDDTEQLYERFPAGEGQAYLVGGFNASYLRKGNTVLIPIRVGAGLRLGVNAGYMRFSHKQRWLPF